MREEREKKVSSYLSTTGFKPNSSIKQEERKQSPKYFHSLQLYTVTGQYKIAAVSSDKMKLEIYFCTQSMKILVIVNTSSRCSTFIIYSKSKF